MSSEERKAPVPEQKTVLKVISKNIDNVLLITLAQLAGRGFVVWSMLLSVALGGKLPNLLAFPLAAAAYIGLVIPLRFWGREQMRRMFYSGNHMHHRRNVYVKWLRVGLLRYLRGLVWGLPFMAVAGYFIIGYGTLDPKTYEAPIHWLAMLFSGDPGSGTGNASLALLIVLGIIVFLGLLFAYGWRRDLAVEYLPVRSLKTEQVFHWARRIRTKHKGEMWKTTLGNILLTLPAVIGAAAVLIPYLMAKVDFSLSLQMVFTLLMKTLRSSLPRLQMIELAAVFVILYLPLCVIRKMRNAAVVGKLMKNRSHHHHHHASGEAEFQTEEQSETLKEEQNEA